MTPEVLTAIYGEEDWSATIRKVDETEEAEEEADNVIALHDARQPHRDRMAGLT
jgi:phosphonate transport system ATP-binding protein